ncbi:glycosyltransferase family 2 protein [Klebsiella pneumoniae]|uniref:Putative glycosyltransferase n=9 Tax=Klebsiella pneumoniae TaxID=573 RepID=A0A1C3SZ88_KLEPN|nr:glycosyltransferase family 2 protein [Klebsiella pneumoniae]HDS2418513.1 glycosyltransferase [Klebsiella pneumoniae subsp. ozaenae]ALQ86761.1 hypothetical protein AQD68_22500 [Klebsiella pneumoniae]ALQ92257.1 hypothetical protein AQD73_22475 [Klebsiella pneumoniae]EIW9295232.1 glycosyltransferase [Klebsiella pneumoniae]EIX9196788.1 glycosyltransferase [Klebsiella pneumoniae]
MKISFVIPAYNAEGYIHECISSILNQGEDGFEIIVINDGSTDRTEEILNQIKSQTTKLTFHTIDNSGQSIARNLGVQYAKGEYIFFIDADDLISPKTIKKLHDIIENECADIVFFNGSAFYDDDQLKSAHSFNYTRNSKYYNKSFDLLSFSKQIIHDGEFIAQPCLYIFRRDFFKNNSFYPGIIHEDNLFTAKMMLNNSGKCYIFGDSLYMRRVRNDSTMTSRKTAKNIIGYATCALELSKLQGEKERSLNSSINRLSVIWFKESLLINKEFELDMASYIKDKIKQSNLNPIYKFILANDFIFTGFISVLVFLKSFKR